MKKRMHPIGWLAIASVLITVLGIGKQASNQSVGQSAEGPREYSTSELVAMLIESDAYEDESWIPQYTDALKNVDFYCTERPQSIVLLAIKKAESEGDLGTQFAVLNILEEVVWTAQDASTQPMTCDTWFE